MSAARRPRPGVLTQARALLEGRDTNVSPYGVATVEREVARLASCATVSELDLAWASWSGIWLEEPRADELATILAVGQAFAARRAELLDEAARA